MSVQLLIAFSCRFRAQESEAASAALRMELSATQSKLSELQKELRDQVSKGEGTEKEQASLSTQLQQKQEMLDRAEQATKEVQAQLATVSAELEQFSQRSKVRHVHRTPFDDVVCTQKFLANTHSNSHAGTRRSCVQAVKRTNKLTVRGGS